MIKYNQDTWNQVRKYENTLSIIFTLACKRFFGHETKVIIEHSIIKDFT